MKNLLRQKLRSEYIRLIRYVLFISGFLVLTAATVDWLLSIGHIIDGIWSYIWPPILTLTGLVISLCGWLFPFSTDSTTQSISSINQDQKSPVSSTKHTKSIQLSPESIFHINEILANRNDFYGRVREREILISRARKGAPTSIIGSRRIGKTWLMHYLLLVTPNKLGPHFRICYTDATLPSCNTVAGFVSKLLKDLTLSSSNYRRGPYNLTVLEKTIRDLRSQGEIPLLLIDEFEGFSNKQDFDKNFFTGLRSLSQEAGLGLIIASKGPLVDIVNDSVKTSPFFNIFDQIKLKPFTIEEAEEFVQAKSVKANFTTQEQARLLQYSQIGEMQWSPLYLQVVGKMLLEEKNKGTQYYHPNQQSYWQDFEKRLSEGLVKKART